jgi:hypothetical protein
MFTLKVSCGNPMRAPIHERIPLRKATNETQAIKLAMIPWIIARAEKAPLQAASITLSSSLKTKTNKFSYYSITESKVIPSFSVSRILGWVRNFPFSPNHNSTK